MDHRSEMSVDELEAVAQMAFSRLLALQERHMLSPRTASLDALKSAWQFWEDAKRALRERRRSGAPN